MTNIHDSQILYQPYEQTNEYKMKNKEKKEIDEKISEIERKIQKMHYYSLAFMRYGSMRFP